MQLTLVANLAASLNAAARPLERGELRVSDDARAQVLRVSPQNGATRVLVSHDPPACQENVARRWPLAAGWELS